MSEIKIWHNPSCSKSRQGLQHLQDLKCEIDVFEYPKMKIDPDELTRLIENSDCALGDFIRTNEREYRELGLSERELTAREFAELAAKHPRLLQRPIVIKDGKAFIARTTDRIEEILT